MLHRYSSKFLLFKHVWCCQKCYFLHNVFNSDYLQSWVYRLSYRYRGHSWPQLKMWCLDLHCYSGSKKMPYLFAVRIHKPIMCVTMSDFVLSSLLLQVLCSMWDLWCIEAFHAFGFSLLFCTETKISWLTVLHTTPHYWSFFKASWAYLRFLCVLISSHWTLGNNIF